jgi:hypothetical protein
MNVVDRGRWHLLVLRLLNHRRQVCLRLRLLDEQSERERRTDAVLGLDPDLAAQ